MIFKITPSSKSSGNICVDLIVLIFWFGTQLLINSLFVWLAWNGFNDVISAPSLTFWQVTSALLLFVSVRSLITEK